MRSLRWWQILLKGIKAEALIPDLAPESAPAEEQEIGETHDNIEEYVIVAPLKHGEDTEQAHGGDDVCQDIKDAPAREEAQGENPYDSDSDSCGEYDHQQIYIPDLAAIRRRRLQTAIATVISKIAEDLSGWQVEGDDEWDMQALMERRINRRSINQCKQSREKDSVVLILDTSGSCSYLSQFFSSIADAAVQAGDVELYTAPNAWLDCRRTRSGWKQVDGNKQETFGWERFRGRTVIFFGDFDGGNAPVLASRQNKVYWFSCEGNRYKDMNEHNWCSFTLADFRGKYYNCTSEDDFLRLVRKVR